MRAAKPALRERASKDYNPDCEQLAESFRRELKLHCYRMLGSLHEAEDLVQETYLRAWRSAESFKGPLSLFRAWLYRIATNACLNAVATRKNMRRFLPDQWAPGSAQMPDGTPARDVAWLEPYPDSNLEGITYAPRNPETRYVSRESVQLAFVAVIQQLPPRQRAVLLLRDVMGWSAGEVAQVLNGSIASINSVLQRGRATLAKRYPQGQPLISAQPSPAQQKLLARYMAAWQGLNLDTFVALLKDDATYTMPPLPQWYAGRQAISTFFNWAWKLYGGFRLVPTGANRQPSFAAYARGRESESWDAHSLH